MGSDLFVLVKLTLVRRETLDMKGCFSENVCCSCSGRWLPSPFHPLPSHTPDKQQYLLTHTNTHTFTLSTYPLPLALLYAHTHTHKGRRTCTHKQTVIWTDMFTLLLIWMSLHCLASFPILKNSTPIIVKATSRWQRICLALAQVTWKLLFFPPLSQFILETILHTPPSAQKGCLWSTAWHIFVRVQDFFFAASHHISSLSQGWYFCVNLRSETHYK